MNYILYLLSTSRDYKWTVYAVQSVRLNAGVCISKDIQALKAANQTSKDKSEFVTLQIPSDILLRLQKTDLYTVVQKNKKKNTMVVRRNAPSFDTKLFGVL